MTREELKLEILKTYFSDECEIAGSSNIEAILNDSMIFVNAKYGANMPVVEVLTLLAVIASLVDNIISTTDRLMTMQSNKPKKEDAKQVVESAVTRPKEIDSEIFDSICIYILEWYQKEHDGSNK